MGCNANDDIFVMEHMTVHKGVGKPKLTHTWRHVPGKLKQISVNRYGDDIWGVNAKDEIYCKNKPDDAWCHVDGRLMQVDVGEIGKFWI